MELNILGFRLVIERSYKQTERLQSAYEKGLKNAAKLAAKKSVEKRKKVIVDKVQSALNEMILYGENYTEYRLQKKSGLSINTIKKYRKFIDKEVEKLGVKRVKKMDLQELKFSA